jgi:glycosyltransferase involved in cell wall biosynthesis
MGEIIYGKFLTREKVISSAHPTEIITKNDSRPLRLPTNKVYVYGFPGLYGGAGTELHHQIIVWRKMNREVHIIPTNAGYKNEPLYQEMLDIGVTVHTHNDFSSIELGAPVLGFCNSEFLDNLPEIYKYTRNTVFVNCMTWLFDKEKLRMREGLIGAFLYQNNEVLVKNKPLLQALNQSHNIKFLEFNPYFDDAKFPFVESRDETSFTIGHISRQDADKYAKNTLHIWEYCVAPVPKKGIILGFDTRTEAKIGKPFDWIKTYVDQTKLSQQDFYKATDAIVQPTDTTENYPRIGFEAMSSGCVLIVDNRGGWRKQVKHGVTGWLCNNEREFIYYASKMAFEPELRKKMALAARKHCGELSSLETSMASWGSVFNELGS